MPKRDQLVVPHDDGWAVRGAGSRRASSVHPTQAAAINAGRAVAHNQGSELYIHGRDGRIRERNTHGHDPYPPRG